MPTDGKSPSETKLKHSPRECLQALTKTPRGGAIPHLLLTPRQEHLYEGEEIQEALQLREDKRRDGEKKKAIYDLAHRIKDAIDSHDVEEVERLQKELAKFEEDEADSGSDEDGRDQRTNRVRIPCLVHWQQNSNSLRLWFCFLVSPAGTNCNFCLQFSSCSSYTVPVSTIWNPKNCDSKFRIIYFLTD